MKSVNLHPEISYKTALLQDINKNLKMSTETSLIRIPPLHYLHVLNRNTNITRLISGPTTFIKKDEEQVVKPLTKMINLKSKTYVVVKNPVVRDNEGELVYTEFGQVKNSFGILEIRTDDQQKGRFFGNFRTVSFVS